VCGEYISNEVLPYKVAWSDINSLNPKHIDKLSFSLVSGKSIDTTLPLGGFGVSRYELDKYLYNEAIKIGVPSFKKPFRMSNFARYLYNCHKFEYL
jgi:hypothetical protein